MFAPWSEPAQLPVISVVGHEHLWADQQDLSIQNDDSAVVLDILVHHWPMLFKRGCPLGSKS